jgi:hypothetical protein
LALSFGDFVFGKNDNLQIISFLAGDNDLRAGGK